MAETSQSPIDGADTGADGQVPPQRPRTGYARILGRLVGRFGRAPRRAPDIFDGPGNRDGSVLIVRASDAPALARRLGADATFALPAEAALDPFAALLEGAGGTVARGAPEPGEAVSRLVVPVLPPGEPDLASLPDLALAPRLRVLPEATTGLCVVAAAMQRSRRLRPDRLPAFDLPLSPPDWAAGPALPRTAPAEHVARALEEAVDAAMAAGAPAGPGPAPPPGAFRLYRTALALARPAIGPYLAVRRRRGKEDPDRLGERRGHAGMTRDPGRWGWIHAASVGESVSVLPLAQQLLRNGTVDHLLMTTGTTTSAELMSTRLPEQAVHQYVPLDVPAYVDRFLDHWRPDFALFVESELWPNMFDALAARAIPAAIVNGRMSRQSHRSWRRRPDFAAHILRETRLCIAQSATYARRFAELGAPNVVTLGNIKLDSPALPAVEGELERFRALTTLRRVWLAASTHEGEEEIIAEAHAALRDRFPDLLTVLVPRHPARGEAIATMLEERWLATARRSTGAEPRGAVDIFIADTIGELGLFYRLAPFAFIGGSLDGTGGHNPVEAALLDCAILHGPDIANFRDMYETFDEEGGAVCVRGADDLVREIERLLTRPEDVKALAGAARRVLTANAGSLERVMAALEPVIGRPRNGHA